VPFTPFHFGPAALIHAIAPRSVSFLAFAASNILIDAEVAVNLFHRRDRLHTFFHTYLGATIIILITIASFLLARKLASKLFPPSWQQFTNQSTTAITLGAIIGAYSHILLDSFMHRDMHPLAPWTTSNPLLGTINTGALHLLCIATGILGIALLSIRYIRQAKPATKPR
jgi:membrane-bound metal-dependent hydrolase YbcI (DUF457 family)